MPAVKVTSERDSTALIFQLKARTSGAKVLAAYAKQTLLDTEGARLCRAEDGSAVDLARPLLDQIADGELLTVTDAPAAAAAPDEEPEPRAEEAPGGGAIAAAGAAQHGRVVRADRDPGAAHGRVPRAGARELAVEREAAVAVVGAAGGDGPRRRGRGAGPRGRPGGVGGGAALRSFVFSCYPDRLAALDAVGASMGAALRDGDAPILVVGGVGAGAVAVALGAERGAGRPRPSRRRRCRVLDNLGGEEARVAPRSPADDDGALDVEVDGVRVVSRHSSALYVEDDEYDVRDDDDASSDDDDAGPAHGRSALPRRADVLVSEIFGQALLEGLRVDVRRRDGAAADRRRGRRPHARRDPRDARRVARAQGRRRRRLRVLVCLHRAMGAADDVYSSVLLDEDVVDVAPPQPAFDFDFRWPEDARPGVCELVFTAQRDAVVTAIALHFDLDMDDAETYDSRTCDGWHWGRPVYVLPTPVRVAAGATLPVTLATNGDFPTAPAPRRLVGPMLAAKGRDARAT
ncbi:hypothetical protein JL721_4508 [Aureococcus anophagefferens]|nr:hypothetical protein JL721_4508 [Aureococcus anophagefferens]